MRLGWVRGQRKNFKTFPGSEARAKTAFKVLFADLSAKHPVRY